MDTQAGGNRAIRSTLRRSADPRVTRTRSLILDAVRTLSDTGEELTVSSITRTAGISRATFYSHHAGLDELADSVLRDTFAFIGELYLFDRDDRPDALRLSQERLVAHFTDNRALYSAAAALPVSKESHLGAVRAMASVISDSLSRHPRVPTGLQIDATARYIAGAAYGLLDAWIGGELELSEGELLDHLLRLLPTWFSGIR